MEKRRISKYGSQSKETSISSIELMEGLSLKVNGCPAFGRLTEHLVVLLTAIGYPAGCFWKFVA
jgi:hypothetical protein